MWTAPLFVGYVTRRAGFRGELYYLATELLACSVVGVR